MLSALLLSAIVLGPPAGVPARAAASQDDPAIRLWLSDDGRYQRGDQAKVQVKTREDGYLLVLNVDPDGRLRILFPLDPGDDDFIRGGRKYEIVGRGGRKGFDVSNRSGRGTVYAAVSRAPFRFQEYVTGDHWDLGALDHVRISDKPEGDLNQFVQQLAATDFDYDVLGYNVYERVVYGGPSAMVYDDYAYDFGYPYDYYPWGYGGTSLFIGLSFGHRHRYNPFFYDPFFYSPFYYPAYYYPYYYPAYYYPYYPVFHYPRPYYPYPYAFYPGRPYYGGYYATPWRRRTNDPLAPGGFQWWRGRDATFGTSATLAGYRTGFGRMPFTPGRAPTATPVRGTVATTDAGTTRRRSLDMTPSRIEATGSRGVIQPTEQVRTPVARRAVEHNETWAGRLPERVGPRGNNASTPAARPGDVGRAPEARPSRSSGGITRSRDEVAPVRDRSGYEGQRVIQARPEARRAEDSGPASRPNIESRPVDRPAPVRMERSEPGPRMERSEPAPRMERSEPAPRMERSEPAPRMERSEPAPRVERSGGGGGGARMERGGGGGSGGNRDGGWRR